jgi:hypothetical protein
LRLIFWIPVAVLAATLAGCETGAPAAHRSPALSTSLPAARTGSAPASGRAAQSDAGIVAGTFIRVGGPIAADGTQPAPVPLMGTVTFSAGHRGLVAVHVGKSGRFSVTLPVGTYVVTGRSPSIMTVLASGATVENQCAGPTPVTVVAGRTVHVSVVCPVP